MIFKKIIKKLLNFFLSKKAVRNLFIDKKKLKIAIGERYNYQLYKILSWVLIDHKESDIDHNFENDSKIPLGDNSVSFIYSSHMIEHISDQALKNLLYEAYRLLKPGASLRLEAPDSEIFIEAYKNKDKNILKDFIENGKVLAKKYKNKSYEEFHNCFLSSLISYIEDDLILPVLVEKKSIDSRLNDINLFEKWAKNLLNSNQKKTHGHINIIYYTKLEKMAKQIGFKKVMKVDYGKSQSNIKIKYIKSIERINDRNNYSFIIEAVK